MYDEIVCTKIVVNETKVSHNKLKLKLGLELINKEKMNHRHAIKV
jgi:hypothetical protein